MDISTKEIAKELTLHVIDHGFHCVNPDHYEDPEAVGNDIAALYNSILESIKA